MGTAVVLGGGIAGMMAARVLADHADQVVIVERDVPSDDGTPRRGVPQGAQVHALLSVGHRTFERWFPGFTDRAVTAGATLVDGGRSTEFVGGVPRAIGPGLRMLTATRPFLEHRLRTELRGVPSVRFVTGRVTGVDFDSTGATAVHYESGGGTRRETAGLVVDALGRASRLGDWLAAAGWERPPMTRVPTSVNYATAYFRRPAGRHPFDAALQIPVGDGAGAAFTPVEGDRTVVMLFGHGDFRPGATAADLVERCRRELPEPFGHAVSGEMLGDVVTYRQADSRRRDYWACERLPARFVSVGDAVASFNPIFGQGMSSAALHASALSMYLRAGPDLDRPARDFFALQRVVVDAAWSISSAADRARAGMTPTFAERLQQRLAARIAAAARTDVVVTAALQLVSQMLRHPDSLRAPRLVRRALSVRPGPAPVPTPPLEPAGTGRTFER